MFKKKILCLLACMGMIASSITPTYAESSEEGKHVKQVSLDTIEKMPNLPSHFSVVNWYERGKKLNDFVFDHTATDFTKYSEFSVKEGRKFSTIYRDDKYGGYMLPAFYGENRPLVHTEDKDGEDDQESISVTSALLAASLLGIDMNKPLPAELKGTVSEEVKDANYLDFTYDTYLDNALKYFWTIDGTDIFTNVPNGSMSELQNMPGAYQAFDDFWYMLIANQNFYRLADLNPNWRPEMVKELQGRVAEKMCLMVDDLGDGNPANCDFNIQGYNFKDMKVVDGGRKQPDGAVGTANILYYSYKIFKDEDSVKANKYLEYSKYCMDYVENLTRNPYYENMLIDAVYLATMMNAEVGTNYDTAKYLRWITLESSSSVRNWGAVNYTKDGIDVYGLTGEGNNGYGYFFNSIYPMTSILPAAKYDPSFARMAGKWAINITNSSKYFLPSELGPEHQTDPEYIGKMEGEALAYESLRKSDKGVSLYATGDAKGNATSGWMAGPNVTNLGLYGGFYTGFLGALVRETNVDNILQLDCNKTDYYQDAMYQTYLYYNPNMESKEVEIDLGSETHDLYDSVTGTYVARNVSGKQSFKVLADSARVIVLAPANSELKYKTNGSRNTTTINDVLVACSDAEILETPGTNLITDVEIQGPATITERGKTTSYTAVLSPDNLLDPRVVWSLTELDGTNTTKATIDGNGNVTAYKNGKILVHVKTMDGSNIDKTLMVSITGQTIPSLSQNKPTKTSSANSGFGGDLAVDGDVQSRWIANSGEQKPWIYVDLGAEANIHSIVLNWETARPPKYELQVSNNGQDWTTISIVDDEGNSKKVVTFHYEEGEVPGSRYVRMYANQKSNHGCSLYEFDVFGTYTEITKPITDITVTSSTTKNEITTKNKALQLIAQINPGDATDLRVEWCVYNEDGSETMLAEMTPTGKLIPFGNGKVKVVAKALDGSGTIGEITINIQNQDIDNLALNKKVRASKSDGGNEMAYAVDGDYGSRWSSGSGNDGWISVDLGDYYYINKIALYWEAAYGQQYKIQGSLDDQTYFDIYDNTDGKGGEEELKFENTLVRYVKMQGVKAALSQYGLSLYEFEVYGSHYKDDLKEVYNTYKDTEGDRYTPNSFEIFEIALTNAQTILAKDGATEEEVVNATSTLETAYIELVERADKSQLITKITDVSALNENDYTPNSYTVLREVLADADVLNTNPNATLEEVTAMITRLTDAVNALVERVEKEDLEKIIEKAEKINPDTYTKDSISILNEVLKEAKELLNNPNASEKEVFDMLEKLEKAINALEVAKEGPDSTITPPNTNTSNNTKPSVSQTGDSQMVVLPIAFMLVSVFGYVILRKKKIG